MSSYGLKRPIDILVSAVALAVSWPLLLLIALWVRIDSRGPALFRQIRVGADESPFEILKFRTMINRGGEVDQASERVITGASDTRITKAGRLLRATSLDELPQLINVIRGDMSLVGPRPIIPDQLAAIPSEHHERFAVRPGLTGLAQVRGRRGLDWLDQLATDAEYVQGVSLLIDIKIILQTVVVVLRGTGVYGGEGSNWRAYRRDGSSATSAADRPTLGGVQ